MSEKVVILPGRNSEFLAKQIAKICGYELGIVKWRMFEDREYKPVIKTNVRKATVYIINATNAPGENLDDVMFLEDAAKRASAKEIIFVCPYFGTSRQERKDEPRTCITAALNAKRINNSRISKFIVFDLHADAIQGFFDMPVDHLFASFLFVKDMEKLDLRNTVFASPDTGGVKRVENYADYFLCQMALFFKGRVSDKPNAIKEMRFVGNVKGKDVILVDDIFDTLGTISKASKILKKEGAESIRAYGTHPVLSGKSYRRMKMMKEVEFIVTDTVPIPQKFLDLPNFRVITIAEFTAEVIKRDVNGDSISEMFIFKNRNS